MAHPLDSFWDEVDSYLKAVGVTRTAQELVVLTNMYWLPSSGAAFFAGSGGDVQLCDALADSPNWTVSYIESDYHWTATGADGSRVEYTEGDIDYV